MDDAQEIKMLRLMHDISNQLAVVVHDLSAILPQALERLTSIVDTLEAIHTSLLELEMKK